LVAFEWIDSNLKIKFVAFESKRGSYMEIYCPTFTMYSNINHFTFNIQLSLLRKITFCHRRTQHALVYFSINFLFGCVWTEGLGGEGRGGFNFLFQIKDIIKWFLENWINNMINDHIILQIHLIYFRKTFYIVQNWKSKSEPSPPKPLIQTHPKGIHEGQF